MVRHLRRVHPPHSHQPPTRATATPTEPGWEAEIKPAYPGYRMQSSTPQPHRRGADAGGNADAGGRGQRPRPVHHRRRGVPEFVYAGEPLHPLGQFPDAAENVIVIDTVSKRSLPAAPASAGPHHPQPGADGPRHEACPVPPVGAHPGPGGLRRPVRRWARSICRRAGGVCAAGMVHAEAPGHPSASPRVSQGGVLRHGPPAGGTTPTPSSWVAGGVRGQRRHRDVRSGRALSMPPRAGAAARSALPMC